MPHFVARMVQHRIIISVLLCATLASFAIGQEQAAEVLPPGDSLPATSESRLAESGDAEQYPGADYIIVHEETINRVDERGVTSTDSVIVYKVLTEGGCRALSALRWGYDPQSSWVKLRETWIIRNGERINVPVDSALDLPAPQSAIYWSDRVTVLQLPRLRVGDGIEVRTYRKGFTYALLEENGATASGNGGEPEDDRFIPPMPGEYFDIVIFQADVPTLEKRYELHLPATKRLHSRIYNGALYAETSYSEEETVYSWWGFDLPAAPHEPNQPDGSDFLPKVVMATVESWEAKSRWFFQVNEGQFDTSPEIDRAVRHILEESGAADGTDDEKAEVLLHWVAQNIRYSGQTMGKGEGFTLHTGTMIFEQRSGVCKDIAGMLVTMLRAAGIQAYGAMTMAGSRIEEVPADQFNHCVVARRTDGGFIMYDPTWVPYNNDIWSKLETEQHYLVGSPEGEYLSRIAYSPPAESPLRVKHDARLLADGTLEGTMRFDGTGALDGRLRRIVSRTPLDRMETHFAEILAPLCRRIEGVTVSHRPADDFSGDMWVEIRYRAPEFALPVNGGLEFTSPAMAVVTGDGYLFRGGAREWPETRESDLFLYYTQHLEVNEKITLPAGFEATTPPQPDTIDETFASFEGAGEAGDGTLAVSARAEVRRRQIPPDGYAGFRGAMSEARNWADAVFRVERKEARP